MLRILLHEFLYVYRFYYAKKTLFHILNFVKNNLSKQTKMYNNYIHDSMFCSLFDLIWQQHSATFPIKMLCRASAYSIFYFLFKCIQNVIIIINIKYVINI